MLSRKVVPIYVGFDPREAVAYHVFCQSVIDHSSLPVAFIPLHKPLLKNFDGQRDGTNAFIFSRYLVPYLAGFNGYALFFDGDMVVNRDIAELWAMRHEMGGCGLGVVKHDYKTKNPRKYIGTRIESDNVDYPRKNWSSVMLWDCGFFPNRVLDPAYVAHSDPLHIHRFGWLQDSQIFCLPSDWNHLVGEDPPGPANLRHYTLGVSGIKHYADDHGSWDWHKNLVASLQCGGELPSEMVKRAEDRIGEL